MAGIPASYGCRLNTPSPLVEMTGNDPATSRLQGGCSTKIELHPQLLRLNCQTSNKLTNKKAPNFSGLSTR